MGYELNAYLYPERNQTMEIARVSYKGSLRTEALHLPSGQMLITDAPKDNQGKGEAFSPTDLMSTSLACCALTIMGIAAEVHEIDMSGVHAIVHKIMASNPRRVARIEVEFIMTSGSFSEKDRQILEKAARTCPVSLSLAADLEQVMRFVWTPR